MGQYLGIHLFDEKGEEILCTYDNAYSAILMDVSVYWMKGDATRRFSTWTERRRRFWCCWARLRWHETGRKRTLSYSPKDTMRCMCAWEPRLLCVRSRMLRSWRSAHTTKHCLWQNCTAQRMRCGAISK